MATDVVMPQMGESIAEGTIVRWIKKVGDKIDRDEPLFEISTDKVDAEIPSPAAGVISEIRVKEGETVPINSIVAVIASAADAASKPAAAAPAPPPAHYHDRDEPAAVPAPVAAAPPTPPAPVPAPSPPATEKPHAASAEEAIRERSSPLVRKIAKENQVDISQIHGTGIAGRVTKDDILGFIDTGQVRSQEGRRRLRRRWGRQVRAGQRLGRASRRLRRR